MAGDLSTFEGTMIWVYAQPVCAGGRAETCRVLRAAAARRAAQDRTMARRIRELYGHLLRDEVAA